jgi:hypothetical protein
MNRNLEILSAIETDIGAEVSALADGKNSKMKTIEEKISETVESY